MCCKSFSEYLTEENIASDIGVELKAGLSVRSGVGGFSTYLSHD